MNKESDGFIVFVEELENQPSGYYKIYKTLQKISNEWKQLAIYHRKQRGNILALQCEYASKNILQCSKLALSIHIKQLSKSTT